ncbi:MAG: ATP-binding protein [Gammaproteobacteria bacterium]
MTTILSPMALKKSISLETRFSELLPEHVHGDPTKITQILINMTNNAIKFTEQGYTLINVYPVKSQGDELVVRFEVIDTGIGISDSAKDRIFERFHQEDASITRKYGGTGLGTAISKRLVNYMGGNIGVSSEVGLGSRFWFELPLQITAAVQNITIEQNVVVFSRDPKLIHQVKQTVEVWDFTVDAYADLNVIEYYTNPGVEKVPAAVVIDYSLAEEANEYIAKIGQQVRHCINFILLGPEKLHNRQIVELYDSILPVPINTRQLYHSLFFKSHRQDTVVTPITVAASFRQRPPSAVTGLNVLICDDEPTNRYVLRELLETMGHIVSECEDGFQALDMLQENDYDMAIIDLQMPEMSGIEVAELYQYAVPDNRIPLVLASANVQAEFIDKSKLYFDAYIEKPIDYQKLSAIITRINEEKIANRQRIRFDLSRVLQTIVFDPSEFANYPKEALEGEFLSSLFEIFIESANKNLVKIRYALERQDIRGFKEQMHSLKGIAGNVKAKQLEAIARKCYEIDRESFENSDNAEYILNSLQNSLNETRQMLFDYLKNELRKNS